MKKPVVDYRRLRLHNLNTPEFSHLYLLLSWLGYFLMYLLTENLIPAENCHVIHCALDDMIPFNEFFAIFYVGWYVMVVFSLGYFLLYNVQSFKNLQTYIIITQILAMAIYIIYPSRQDLRPETFPRDNILTALMGLIYSADTSTGVFPSLHVAYSLGMISTWLREKQVSKLVKTVLVTFLLMICISVAFVKQHSVLDILGAIPICLVAEWFVFFRKKKKRG